ncbi:hypothetical protein DFA_10667 [Cavenderia fasciculata]|uniref:Uncharacterized protein n=1 Tax=Cavenderia fasciculata TaxID=261658 RepID=F4QB22_CACFS|nr:uncharacterized protein DFA_10667 [Cavenderia fasciculata]EGG14794.1 hypothetical protein DFA_10667 [Cavenderia fasciculata]|eukprot:XP_004351310.1 hypothetical protein DFA_10667 [Cavenderia fasciculata]
MYEFIIYICYSVEDVTSTVQYTSSSSSTSSIIIIIRFDLEQQTMKMVLNHWDLFGCSNQQFLPTLTLTHSELFIETKRERETAVDSKFKDTNIYIYVTLNSTIITITITVIPRSTNMEIDRLI